MTRRPRALMLMREALVPHLFADADRAALDALVLLLTDRANTDVDAIDPAYLSEVELLITGWFAPPLGAEELDRMPKLCAIAHAGGGTGFIAAEAWERGIQISTAADANAIPVAEFTVAMIVLAGKDAFWVARDYRRRREEIDREAELAHIGNYGRTIGLIGASRIGARVAAMLRGYDAHVLLFDPYCTPDRARELGAELVPDLAELVRRCSILSVHAPSTPATVGLVSADILAALPDRATVINTARGEIIDQEALVAELTSGRLRAVLDVTDPEVLPADHPLHALPNVFITPHLAGAAGNELHRLGASAVAEIGRFVRGEPFAHPAPRTGLF